MTNLLTIFVMVNMACLSLQPSAHQVEAAETAEGAAAEDGEKDTGASAEDDGAQAQAEETPAAASTGQAAEETAGEEIPDGYPKSAKPGVYMYDYAGCVSDEFEEEFNTKIGESGGHFAILVVNGFDDDKYKYEYYFNEVNGIEKSALVVFNVTQERKEGEHWVYIGTRGSEEENVAGHKMYAWLESHYRTTGRVPPHNVEHDCQAMLEEHLYLLEKYPYPGEEPPTEREIGDPFVWYYFIHDITESVRGFLENNSEAFGMLCAVIFLASTAFLLIMDTLGGTKHRIILEPVKSISMAGLMADAVLVAWLRRWILPEGGLPAVGNATQAAFVTALVYAGCLFMLTVIYSLTALLTYEYSAEAVIRLLFSKLNRYTAEGMLGFIVYAVGIFLYNGMIMGGGLTVSLIWAGIDLKKKMGSLGASWKERSASNVYGLVPLHAKEDLSFGCMERTKTTFFKNIHTRASLDARYRQLAKIYHPDGQASVDEAENETFERIKKEYDKLKEKLPPDGRAA